MQATGKYYFLTLFAFTFGFCGTILTTLSTHLLFYSNIAAVCGMLRPCHNGDYLLNSLFSSYHDGFRCRSWNHHHTHFFDRQCWREGPSCRDCRYASYSIDHLNTSSNHLLQYHTCLDLLVLSSASRLFRPPLRKHFAANCYPDYRETRMSKRYIHSSPAHGQALTKMCTDH